jgi:putative addiction module component (TIGR02574 family)
MTKAAKQVLSDAMALADSERAELAARLLDTLDATVDKDYVPAWEAEIAQRVRELDNGTVTPIPWKTAREMIRQGDDAEAD